MSDQSKRRRKVQETEVDKVLEESFPASDPPSYSIPHDKDQTADETPVKTDRPARRRTGNRPRSG